MQSVPLMLPCVCFLAAVLEWPPQVVVGQAGATIGQIGIVARRKLEKALGRKVHLIINVKVAEARIDASRSHPCRLSYFFRFVSCATRGRASTAETRVVRRLLPWGVTRGAMHSTRTLLPLPPRSVLLDDRLTCGRRPFTAQSSAFRRGGGQLPQRTAEGRGGAYRRPCEGFAEALCHKNSLWSTFIFYKAVER